MSQTGTETQPVALSRRRRALQFSTRSALLVFVIVALVLAFWIVPLVRRAQAIQHFEQQKAVVLEAGTFDPQNAPRFRLIYRYAGPTGWEDSRYRPYLLRVQEARFDFREEILPADLQALAAFPELQRLQLFSTELATLDLRPVQRLAELSQVFVSGPEIPSAALANVLASSRLKTLTLHSNVALGDGRDGRWQRLAELEDLELYHFELSASTFAALGRLPKLKQLRLIDCAFRDAGFASFQPAASLQRLDIHRVPLSDASVPALQRLTGLTELNLLHTEISPAGNAALRTAFPQSELRLYGRVDLPASASTVETSNAAR